jgi:hypothetical protein
MKDKKELKAEFDKLFADLKRSDNKIKRNTVYDILHSKRDGWFCYEGAIETIKECNKMFHIVEGTLIPNLQIGKDSEYVKNPISGAKCLLNPLQVALYDYIVGAEMIINSKNYTVNKELEEKFDNARLYFHLNWIKEYLILID